MSVRRVLVGRIPFALLLAFALVLGTLVGGTAYEAAYPAFSRIVWVEFAGADANGGSSIRRTLFADGRFLALTPDGYQAGILSSALTDEIFSAVRARVGSWHSTYETNGLVGERVEIELDGPTPARVVIENPTMNFELPVELGRVLRLLAAADGAVAHQPFVPSGLRFSAVEQSSTPDGPLEALPVGFPLSDATHPGGVAIAGGELSILKAIWTDLDHRFDTGTSYRFVAAEGRTWRVSWMLDLDAIGPLSASAGKP